MAAGKSNPSWQVWVDTGGTFTDCVAVDPGGNLHRAKVLSSSSLRGIVEKRIDARRLSVRQQWEAPPDFIRGFRFRLLEAPGEEVEVVGFDPSPSVITIGSRLRGELRAGMAFEVSSAEEAPIVAARLATATPPGSNLPEMNMRLATTRGTNALLERRGSPLVLFVTRGFGDLLRIGTQQRPDLFALEVRRPEPLYSHLVEVPERVGADGAIIEPLQLENLRQRVTELVGKGLSVAAIGLINSYCNPCHEEELAAFLKDAGFVHVSCSASLAPLIKILPRCETAVVNAYLAVVIETYLRDVSQALCRGRLHVMTSAGGLVSADSYRPKDSLLSGPAGGVAGAAAVARRSGFDKIIGFDMGGTSTDVARFDGDYEYVFEHQVGDAHLLAPALAIESVAAGGGSICSFDGDRLEVGPQSAGARPGPACYGAGGPLTLTDVNLLLGRLDPSRFGIPVDKECASVQLDLLCQAVGRESSEPVGRESLLEGWLAIANERMADAIRSVSLRRGCDPADYALVAFGGAGAQHACGVAARLGVKTILVPPDAGLLSAFGLGEAVIERFAQAQILRPLAEVEGELSNQIESLACSAREAVVSEGIPLDQVTIRRRIVSCRYAGQESSLAVEYDEAAELRAAFERRYSAVFGYLPQGRAIEIEAVRVVACSKMRPEGVRGDGGPLPGGGLVYWAKAWFDDQWRQVAVHERRYLICGKVLAGPCLVMERHSATVVEPGWDLHVDENGLLVIRRGAGMKLGVEHSRLEAAELELFTNRFRAIATEMGDILQRTALSTNVKERLDFSCAILDREADLVVNAPHIPVHLGALGLCVKRVREALTLGPGDVVVTNHPDFGGSHLPDVTVVTPAYSEDDDLIGYVASRAHHAEIGGSRPGSMPPRALNLAEEGVVLPPCYVLKEGKPNWQEIEQRLTKAPLPTRALQENLADLRAAVAANQRGVAGLRELVTHHGLDTVERYMGRLNEYAERRLRKALSRFGNGCYEAEEELDDGSPLRVRITTHDGGATVDFTGSADLHPGNLNATPAVVRSAVIYVLRLLLSEPLPLNDGLLRAVELKIPRGILNPGFPADPLQAPAVVGGNVETSQRLVDTLLKALGLAACSQGTMNNLLFGTRAYSYYETICGGCGGGPGFNGATAVHSHMTNTRITDCELIERRYPVRLLRFSIRRGSGGAGEYSGGDGVVREFLFLERMSLSVLSQHRRQGPYGVAGGEPGKAGAQRLVRACGESVHLDAIAEAEVCSGDRLVVETPGGGGWGRPR